MQKVSIWFCLPWPFPDTKINATFKGCRDCRFLYIHCKSCMYIHSMWLQQCLFCVQRRLRRDWQPTGGAVRSGAWWSSVRWEKRSQHTKMTRNETVSAPSESAVSVGIILHCGLSLMLCVQMDRNSQLCLSQFRGQHYWPSVSLSLMLCKVSHVSFSVAGRAGAPVPSEE